MKKTLLLILLLIPLMAWSQQDIATPHPLDARHFLLDGSLSDEAVASKPFLFNNFQEAVAHLADGTDNDPMVLYIAPWVYWVDDPDDPTVAVGKDGREPFGMTIRCQHLHLVGLGETPADVVLASQRGQTQGAVGNFTMFDFHGDGLQVSNLTMGNYCNVDLEYPARPQLGRKKRSSAITQAHVAYCHGDRVVARNVRFISRLNMNPLNGARRILYDNCHMECTDDALTGNGVYLHCDFDFYGQKPFYTTHAAGAVMLDCDFNLRGGAGDAYFCKAPGPLALIDCRFHSTKPVTIGWTPYPTPWLRCQQANVTLNGEPLLVGDSHPECTIDISRLPLLKAYKTAEGYNVDGLLAGDDGWRPMGSGPAVAAVTNLTLAPRIATTQTDGEPLLLKANLRRHGGYAAVGNTPLKWSVTDAPEGSVTLTDQGDGSCLLTSHHQGDEPLSIVVTATTPDGLQGAAGVTLNAAPLPTPTIKGKPAIKVKDGVATLNYQLSDGTHGDQSDVTWLLADDKEGREAVAVAVTTGEPLRQYHLKGSDAGKVLVARIRPRHARSDYGEPVNVVFGRLKRVKTVDDKVLTTDFSDFPCQWQPAVKEGFWTVDGYKPADTAEFSWAFDPSRPMWEYGEGFNGAVGKGLLQAQRGARMMFTPLARNYGDMEVALDVDPTKTAGQGFGSATGQYMDVCLKFDTRTLTGYALRIIRTPKHAKAVDFQLMRYDNGKTTPLGEAVSATCYRTGCHIKVSLHGDKLEASVTTDTPLPQPDDPVLLTQVHLSAKVAPSPYGGFCLQHTGSCGESTTMLHHLSIKWE